MSIPGSASPLFLATAAAAAAAPAAHQIDRSLRFNDDDTANLSRTPSSASNRKTWTWSAWVKRSGVGIESNLFTVGSSSTEAAFRFNANDTLQVRDGGGGELQTDAKFRDPFAWYHIVVALDNTKSTNTDRFKLYVNGVEQTYSSASYAAQNTNSDFNKTTPHYIGRQAHNTSHTLDGYLAEVHWVDGRQLAATDFGEPRSSDGVWVPKEFTDHNSFINSQTFSNNITTTGNSGNWSTTAGIAKDKAFNNDDSNYAHANADGSAAAVVTLTLSPAIAAAGSVSFRGGLTSGGSGTISINGGTATNLTTCAAVDPAATDITTVSFSGNVSTITITKTATGGQGLLVYGFEIDGKRLVDNGVSVTSNSFYLKFADNSTNAALGTDSSGNSNTWTVNNLTASASGAVSVIDLDGNDSIEYPGPGDGISGDFTMECFFLMDSSASGFQRIFSTKESSYSDEQTMIRRKSDGTIQFYAGNSSPADHTGGSITSGVWHHAAIVRSGSTVSYYYDGSRLSTDTYSTSFDITKLVVGGGYGSENFNGDVHGARFTNGQALYTGSSYTVPTSGITTTSQSATASNVKVLAGTTSTVNENAGTLGNGTSSGDPTAGTAAIFGIARDQDSMLDTPTNYAAASGNNGGNYATLNSISPIGRDCTFSNGNLDVVVGDGFQSTNNDGIRAVSTIGMTSGKWYFEHEITGGSVARSNVGVVNDIHTYGFNDNHWVGRGPGDYIVWSHNGKAYNNGNETSYGVSWTTGDIIGCAFDADNGSLYVYKNGTVMNSGTAAHTGLTNGPYYFVCTERLSSISANFGQRPFAYTPPTGYVSLCTENLSQSAYASIPDGSKAFDVDLFTGTNSTLERSNFAFSPDLLWFKSRNASRTHVLIDTVRGRAKALESQGNGADYTSDANRDLVSFDNDGFTVGQTQHFSSVNRSGDTIVVWGWDAGTSTASNTDGSITSSVRVSQANGFSIATYTGNGTENSTVGHGLNAAPSLVIIKNRSSSYAWAVLHTSAGTTGTTLDGSAEYYMLQLNSTAARNDFTNDNIWNPTSSTFKINGEGTGNWVNKNGDNYVAYSWAPVEGFSAFGSYKGNGASGYPDADGPFVFTGMRPRYVLIKASTQTENWVVYDTARSTYNVLDDQLYPNVSTQETSGDNREIDVYSNGFKIRSNSGQVNSNNATYIWAAWAEHPFKTARAR